MADQVLNTKDIDRKKVNLIIFPKGKSSFRLYADDGISYGFEKGSCTETIVECIEDVGNFTKINIRNSNLLFSPEEYRFEIHVNAKPDRIFFGKNELFSVGYKNMLNKVEEGWHYDEFNSVLHIKIKSLSERPDELTITHGEAVTKPAEYREADTISGQLPFILPAASIPCKIRCVNFDRGGEGVAYHTVGSRSCELYRNDTVEIELSDDIGAGYNVKDLADSEWLEYTVNVREERYYRLDIRVQGHGSVCVDFDQKTFSDIISIDEKGWNTVELGTVRLSAGEQVMKISVRSGSLRLNWLEISKAE